VEIVLQGDLLQRRIDENGERQRADQEGKSEFRATRRDAKQERRRPQGAAAERERRQRKNAEQDDTAINSVADEITVAVTSADRTDGRGAAVVACPVDPVMPRRSVPRSQRSSPSWGLTRR
jgi:hypothetical protein